MIPRRRLRLAGILVATLAAAAVPAGLAAGAGEALAAPGAGTATTPLGNAATSDQFAGYVDNPLGGLASMSDADVGTTHLAGYSVTPVHGLASASATFTVAAAACTKKDTADGAEYWAGVYTDTVSTAALVQTVCTTTGVTDNVEVVTQAQTSVITGAVVTGDTVVTSMLQSGSTTEAEVHDLTTGHSWYSSTPLDIGDTSIDIGTANDVDASGIPIPTFATLTLFHTTVNGDALGLEHPQKYNSVDGTAVLIKSGEVHTGQSGTRFSVRFVKAR